jgi:ribosomal protein S18 acetylase RimI-like enzyme
MYQTRSATVEDAAIITEQRRRMFIDAGRADTQALKNLSTRFEPWVKDMIAQGKYIGWLMEDGGKVIAGAGLMIMDWPPHPLDPGSHRGYLLNVYVDPQYRRKKLGSQLVERALAEARQRNIRVVSLHSTEAGRPMYESNGFRPTDEMFFVEQFND